VLRLAGKVHVQSQAIGDGQEPASGRDHDRFARLAQLALDGVGSDLATDDELIAFDGGLQVLAGGNLVSGMGGSPLRFRWILDSLTRISIA
jgi:hypothetical protein